MSHIHIMSSVGKFNNYVLNTLKYCRYAVRKTWIQAGIFFLFFFFYWLCSKRTHQNNDKTPKMYIQNHKPQTHVPYIKCQFTPFHNIFTQTLQTVILFRLLHRSKQI